MLPRQRPTRIRKKPALRLKLTLIAAIAFLCLTGCAKSQLKGGDQDNIDTGTGQDPTALSQYELIAIDLVNAMVQVDKLRPTTLPDIKLNAPKGSFGGALFAVLDSAGYNVQKPELGLVIADLSWTIKPVTMKEEAAEGVTHQTFSITLNDATVARNYQLGEREVKPTSNLVLNGVNNTPIKLHDELFNQVALPSEQPRTAEARRDAANAALGGSLRNIFEIGGSNYQDQIGMFKHAGSLVINFPDESVELSRSASVQLRRFLNSVSRGSDAVWVIGCSIGSTQKPGGNESLARARTRAVADWLKKSGMENERLFDESCWAEEPTGLNMPKRGVQLTLLRERKN